MYKKRKKVILVTMFLAFSAIIYLFFANVGLKSHIITNVKELSLIIKPTETLSGEIMDIDFNNNAINFNDENGKTWEALYGDENNLETKIDSSVELISGQKVKIIGKNIGESLFITYEIKSI